MFRLYGALLVPALLVVLLGGAYYYYNSSQKTITNLRESVTELNFAVKQKDEAFKQMTEQNELIEKLNRELAENLKESQGYISELREKFARININRLAETTPDILEGKINSATKKVFDDLRSITSTDIGDQLQPAEWYRKSTTSNWEENTYCPQT